MSITFEIVKFKKPTKDDLSNLHMFNPYGSIPILDDDGDSTGGNIYMFRADDRGIQNIINSCYAVKMELPEYITDYDSFFEDLGFPKEAVRNGDVWLTQKAISQLFDVDRSVVTKHLSNIFKEGELDGNSTCANFAQVADNGKHTNTNFIR